MSKINAVREIPSGRVTPNKDKHKQRKNNVRKNVRHKKDLSRHWRGGGDKQID